ncbi:MAG: helix-turn-helix transcriptional regulator, partial [Acidimicrobiia bacterium]|nr:helix-turn-helix transcriptional regulator [Acidimicrobiia bacterium]
MPRISAALIDEHREATRRALFDAALDLFARQGYVETTLGALADHAGIGRTTFYDYFTDKDDLLASLVEEYLPAVFESMIEEIPRSLPLRDQLATLVVSMVEFV